jgi:hypothetical protein
LQSSGGFSEQQILDLSMALTQRSAAEQLQTVSRRRHDPALSRGPPLSTRSPSFSEFLFLKICSAQHEVRSHSLVDAGLRINTDAHALHKK